ncbi:hypothetical protein [Dethiothermospora halolimnae]|uniref:hypothetical protein n=1 Tax=Dethiothermospora halolimnae TaxID=3114390 RepID=UPI003CCBCC18
MRKYLAAEVNKHRMVLKQLGAKLEVVNSLMCYVTFDLDGIEISYVYNVNRKNQYFLERIKPYSEPAGTFESEQDVIDTIKTDIEQFKNAKKCKVFDLFININKELNKTVREFEDLYLYYNIPHEHADAIKSKLLDVQDLIFEAKKKGKRIYFKKDPKNI